MATATSCSDDATGRPQPVVLRISPETLETIDSAVSAYSPEAITMIREAMYTTRDSMTRHALNLRLIQSRLTLGIDPDSIDWLSTERFLTSLPESPEINTMLGRYYNLRAYNYRRLYNSPDSSLYYFGKSAERFERSDTVGYLPFVLANIADIHHQLNDLPQAAALYRRALFLADSLHIDAGRTPDLYMGLARIYTSLRDYESAGENFAIAERHYDSLPLNMKVYYLNSLGNMLYASKNYVEAAPVFRRLVSLLHDSGFDNDVDMALARINLADVELNLGDTEAARADMESADSLFRHFNIEPGIYYANTIRIGLALHSGNTGEVERILASEHLTEPMEFSIVNIRGNYLHRYYAERGDYRRAYATLLADMNYNDSLRHNIVNMQTAEIMARHAQDTLRLHHRIIQEHKDAEIIAREETIWVIVLVAAMLLLGAMLVLLWDRKRRLDLSMQLMELKLSGLRGMLTPHFLFNMLNRRISRSPGAEADELTALTRLLRKSLQLSGHTVVSLADELDFVSSYVDTVAPTLPGLLFTTEIDPAIDPAEVEIPPMFVELLVENAMKHALPLVEGEKRLKVTVSYLPGPTCRIEVADNGPGFDITRVSTDSTGKGLVAIRNAIPLINRRLHLGITLNIVNRHASDGRIEGCSAILTVKYDPTRSPS